MSYLTFQPLLAAVDPWILAFSLITVIVTVAMGFRSAKTSKTASDFFVAGRSVSVGWNASAISGEYLSAASFMGVAGMVMSVGYDALWYPVCYACGYLFLLLFIAGPLRRFGAYTIPDFAEGRYDSPVFRKIAVIFVMFIGFFYTMPQMKGAGTTLAYIFNDIDLRGSFLEFLATKDAAGAALKGLPYWAGVVLVGAVITLNVALGGMKGITLVQAVQYWIKVFAISVPIFVLISVYGHYGKQLEVNGKSSANSENAFKNFLSIPYSHPPLNPLDTNFFPSDAALSEKVAWTAANLTDSVTISIKTNFSAKEALEHYAMVGRQSSLLVAPEVTNKWTTFDVGITGSMPMPRKEFLDKLSTALAANQIGLIHIGNDKVVAVPASQLSNYEGVSAGASVVRKTLPAKAPADEKWISPFGTLTTKAAAKAGLKAEEQKPYSLLYTYSLIIALVCGTAGLPHILVRFYTNPDGIAAKRTTMWVMILIGVFYVFPPVFGVLGRNLLPELYAGVGAKGTDKIVLELPHILNERVPYLGSILSGITCAGAFAAFMSTFSGLLVSMTGALAHDVYGRILRPKSTPEQRMRMFKYAAVLIGGIAILLGMQVEALEINFMVGQAFAIAAASYFPLLFMSVWWRGMTQKGAAIGMLTGGLLALLGITLTSVSDIVLKSSQASGKANPLQGLEQFWIGNPAIRIMCEQPAIWAVPLAITLMIVISKLTSKEVPADIRMKMLVLHAPEKLGLKQEYIEEHQGMPGH